MGDIFFYMMLHGYDPLYFNRGLNEEDRRRRPKQREADRNHESEGHDAQKPSIN